ncbi:MAG TPA: bifunctional 4-hydroxy-2-oxoglutarate aldolase/2-dehydro-3-deoxy-phosphogluconate aldolase [Hyphomicrobiaceae bacterium]|nr:bifunctional 4-hydroxy-2-oxoglutarate aldolase/2-dehydro-3-deoxy-phosphogluconate aldolase [Hyphomicrobiaceae bacterium]
MTALKTDAPGWREQAIVPVLTMRKAANAARTAEVLAASGLRFVEVTLRTPEALSAIRTMVAANTGAIVGAGSIRSPRDIDDAIAAGAQFLVSPGQTDTLLEAGLAAPVPFIPAAATPAEMMRAMEAGFPVVKFFPAEASGGIKALSAILAPLHDLAVMPTGGITPANAADYLKIPNVVAVGGSWMVKPDDLDAGRFDTVAALAREAAAIGRKRG